MQMEDKAAVNFGFGIVVVVMVVVVVVTAVDDFGLGVVLVAAAVVVCAECSPGQRLQWQAQFSLAQAALAGCEQKSFPYC